MIKKFLVLAITVSGIPLAAQQPQAVSLDQLQQMAKENYPLIRQKDLNNSISGNKVKQLSTNFLPQVAVAGMATYQSEVTEIAIPGFGAGFKQKPDQYSLGLELKETLFDYGMVKTQKRIEVASNNVQNQQIDVDMIKLKERINLLYANIYLQKENRKINQLRIDELDAKRKKMQSAVNNGAALESNFLVLESEYLSTQQRIEEINSNLVTWFKTLSLLAGKDMDTSTVLAEADRNKTLQSVVIRPEYKLYEFQSTTLKLRESMVDKNNLPKLAVFARGYYGRPGYNFLNNDFRPYGLVGASLSWNISGYYTSGREKTNFKINNDLLNNQKQLFDINLQSTLIQEREEISRLERIIGMDGKIVEAKTAIRKSSGSQLDNGVITSSDYIVDLNSETQARFNLKLHEIQLIMAKESYNTTLGY